MDGETRDRGTGRGVKGTRLKPSCGGQKMDGRFDARAGYERQNERERDISPHYSMTEREARGQAETQGGLHGPVTPSQYTPVFYPLRPQPCTCRWRIDLSRETQAVAQGY